MQLRLKPLQPKAEGPTEYSASWMIEEKRHLVAKLSPLFGQRCQQFSKWVHSWKKCIWHKPIQRFCESHLWIKVCLSHSMKKVKNCFLAIFGLLKVTKMLDRCEVCPSGPTKKAHKYKAKTRNAEKAHTQGRSFKLIKWQLPYGQSPKKYKISQNNIFMQSPRVTYPLLGYWTSIAKLYQKGPLFKLGL